MPGVWVKKRVWIVVRTYPSPAKSTIEASCTAAISDDGQWVRMFPVPARLMDQDKRFAKWQWIDVNLLKAPSDSRPESYKPLEKIPFDFRYKFRCGDVDCNGHTMICTDWEMAQAYRSWRREYGDQWEIKFRQTFETEMIEKKETHFFVGTIHQHPGSWIIVGLFYPPLPAMDDLFDMATKQ